MRLVDLRGDPAHESGLYLGAHERPVEMAGVAPLRLLQQARFAFVQPAQGPRTGARVLAPLVRIDVAQVEDARYARSERKVLGVLCHRRREYEYTGEWPLPGQLASPVGQLRVPVIVDRQCAALHQAGEAAQPASAAVERPHAHFTADLAQLVDVLPVFRVVHEGSDVHLEALAQDP